MISNAFKSAYTNQVAQQNQGINTISSGVKSVATITALGFGASSGGLTSLANKVLPGLGGALTNATSNEKIDSLNEIANASNEAVGASFDKVASGAKSAEEFRALDTVWNKIQSARQKATEDRLVSEVAKSLKEDK